MHELIEKGTPWTLKEVGTDPEVIKQNETLFSLSNGHIGTRGSLEETHLTPEFSHSKSTLMNGFFDTDPITYGEWAYGYATHHQTTIPIPDGKKMEMKYDGEVFDLTSSDAKDHNRTLDLKKGILTRSYSWKTENGHELEVSIERFVSYDYPEIMAQRFILTPKDDNNSLEVSFELDDLKSMGKERDKEDDPDPRKKEQASRRFESDDLEFYDADMLHIKTHASGLHAVVGNRVVTDNDVHQQISDKNRDSLSFYSKANQTIVIDRFVAYSELYKEESLTENIIDNLIRTLKNVTESGYEKVKAEHISTMESFWEHSDIQIDGEPALQLGLRFNLFHLHQAAGRDGKTNMSAKGLTGEGYEGHYFWDTEMYMFPFFLYTQPEIARSLLMYRYSILPQAKERARTMAIANGALFAWRTINGEEASPYYPAGTAQIHINADIAHAIYSYGEVTGDDAFMLNEGLEMLVETARFWLEWGHFDDNRGGAFVINDVTGPDEYTAIVNNNYYTNLMAKKNLAYAIEWIEKRRRQLPDDDFNVSQDELTEWKKAEEHMYLPYDEDKQLTMQDDSFFHKKVWDFEQTPKENYPLLLNYHPLTIYKHQVCKQADTVLAQFLFLDDFSKEQKKRDFDYYEKVTTHDSSLSRSVFGMMASQIGEEKKAYDYFMDTALMDISDLQSNTKDGVHAANMGGTWMSMVQGFAGLRVDKGTLHFSPQCPSEWERIVFKVRFQKRLIQVSMTPSSTDYQLVEGDQLTIIENGEKKTL